jgi:uncharacterized UBP type Zn finger protein
MLMYELAPFVQACLSCTTIACGRYTNEHALEHYNETSVGAPGFLRIPFVTSHARSDVVKRHHSEISANSNFESVN